MIQMVGNRFRLGVHVFLSTFIIVEDWINEKKHGVPYFKHGVFCGNIPYQIYPT